MQLGNTLTIWQAATKTGVPYKTLGSWLSRRLIPGVRKANGAWQIPESVLPLINQERARRAAHPRHGNFDGLRKRRQPGGAKSPTPEVTPLPALTATVPPITPLSYGGKDMVQTDTTMVRAEHAARILGCTSSNIRYLVQTGKLQRWEHAPNDTAGRQQLWIDPDTLIAECQRRSLPLPHGLTIVTPPAPGIEDPAPEPSRDRREAPAEEAAGFIDMLSNAGIVALLAQLMQKVKERRDQLAADRERAKADYEQRLAEIASQEGELTEVDPAIATQRLDQFREHLATLRNQLALVTAERDAALEVATKPRETERVIPAAKDASTMIPNPGVTLPEGKKEAPSSEASFPAP